MQDWALLILSGFPHAGAFGLEFTAGQLSPSLGCDLSHSPLGLVEIPLGAPKVFRRYYHKSDNGRNLYSLVGIASETCERPAEAP